MEIIMVVIVVIVPLFIGQHLAKSEEAWYEKVDREQSVKVEFDRRVAKRRQQQ